MVVTGLALVGVRAADGYVDRESKPVTYLAELQHAVDDEARIEVRVDLGTRIQPGDTQALANDVATVGRMRDLLEPSAVDEPTVRNVLAEVASYQAALAKEVQACKDGLYTDCNADSSLLVQPEHTTLLQSMSDALDVLTARQHVANLFGELVSSALVVLAGLACSGVMIVAWRRRESARRAEAAAMRRGEARFRALLQSSFDVITVIGADGSIQWSSDAVQRLFGYEPGEMVGRSVNEWVHPDDLGQDLWDPATDEIDDGAAARLLQCRVQHSDGNWRWVEMAITNRAAHPDINGIVLNLRDITERKTLQTQLEHQALHDPLTRLGNRALLRARLTEWLGQRAPDEAMSVLFLDLDDFKGINDGMGHSAGDELLIRVAASLQNACRAGDIATRLGGDEFAVLLRYSGTDEARMVAERLLHLIDTPILIGGREVRVGASLGIATLAADNMEEIDAEVLLRRADLAMYAAKASGKGHVEVYEIGLEESVLRRLDMANELRLAVENGDFILQYQPLMDLKDGSFHSVEALVRWRHPTRGMIPPLEFIGMAEETGLIVGLGQFVLETACAQMAAWTRMMPETLFTVAINVSSRQLREVAFIPTVFEVLRKTGLDPTSLVVEITESVLVDDLVVIRERLESLRARGIKIAIDDFGSGYSSLSYLRKLPCDIVKIDRAFVDGVENSPESRSLTRAIVRLLDSLDVEKVAEGIETVEQLNYLMELGVDVGQGYYFAKPMDPELIMAFVTGHPAHAAV